MSMFICGREKTNSKRGKNERKVSD